MKLPTDKKGKDNLAARTTMNALEYSIQYMQSIRKSMLAIDDKNLQMAQAIGSVLIILVSNMIRFFEEVIHDSAQNGLASATNDLKEIQKRFNSLIDDMVKNS